jgi:hypothetical protein
MGRTKEVQAFSADDQPVVAVETIQETGPVIADNDTMTIYGQTMGEIIELKDTVINRKHDEIITLRAQIDELSGRVTAKEAKIAELVEYSQKKNTEIGDLKKDLGVARMAVQQAKASTIPQKLERLAGGGIRLAVTLDVDEAAPLLSWSDSAGEDPATYIAAQIKDALLAVTSS